MKTKSEELKSMKEQLNRLTDNYIQQKFLSKKEGQICYNSFVNGEREKITTLSARALRNLDGEIEYAFYPGRKTDQGFRIVCENDYDKVLEILKCKDLLFTEDQIVGYPVDIDTINSVIHNLDLDLAVNGKIDGHDASFRLFFDDDKLIIICIIDSLTFRKMISLSDEENHSIFYYAEEMMDEFGEEAAFDFLFDWFKKFK